MPTPTREQIAEELAEAASAPDQRRAAMVSAPVSRETPTGGGYSQRYRPNSSVTLSPEQRAMARSLGVSETEYARGVLRLRSEVERGERQNG